MEDITRRKNRIFLSIMLGFALPLCAGAQDFDKFFRDSTLRLDYIFAGDSRGQHIYVDELCMMKGWAGRRQRLSELPLEGNGQITITDERSGEVIYRYSFSTLFQEWQTSEEAARVAKSFENSFLIPFPKAPVKVLVTLTDTHRKVCGSLEHRVDPSDILIRRLSAPNVETRYIGQHGDPSQRIDVAILAEGYSAKEKKLFYEHCHQTVDAILSHEPFASCADRFNFVAVMAPSSESGVSVPASGMWKSTAVDSHFSTFYSDRYLTTLHIKQIHNLLSGVPYEHIIILANTPEYGGGGIYNSYTLTSTGAEDFRPIVVHEFGHSFGGLADEYYYDDQYESQYPSDTEPWEPNITTLVDFDSKWKDMLPEGTPVPCLEKYDGEETMRRIYSNEKGILSPDHDLYNKVGVYEGGGYQSKGVWRPVHECRMKINAAPVFCPVCRRALLRIIDFYTVAPGGIVP